jgi:hypothetical protein
MKKEKMITLDCSNIKILSLESVKLDNDFKSFMVAAKQSKVGLQYAVFFETEAVHEGINGNGVRFFHADFSKLKDPFLYTPVKYEHFGPIIGAIVSSKYTRPKQGDGTVTVKGVLWTLEDSYVVTDILTSLANNPESYKTSMECYYDAPELCDYGIGNTRISYDKFMEIKEYAGMDYKGKGIVWKRANNLTFTGLAFTTTPADPNTEVKMIKDSQGLMQKAYASIIETKQNQDNGQKIICPHCSNEILLASMEAAHKEGVMQKGPKEKQEEVVEDIEELEDDTDEEVEDETEDEDEVDEEVTEEDDTDEEVEDEDEDEIDEEVTEEDTEIEETLEDELDEEKPKIQPKKKPGVKQTEDVSKGKRVKKSKTSDSANRALKLKLEKTLKDIKEIYEAMQI